MTSGEVTGILYRGDAKTKYSKPNEPTINRYTAVNPYDISLISQMKNIDETSKFMLLQIDANEDSRQILPTAPTASEFTNWKVSPERHLAYAERGAPRVTGKRLRELAHTRAAQRWSAIERAC